MLISHPYQRAAETRWVNTYQSRQFDRRTFLKGVATAGLSLASAPMLLTACDTGSSYATNVDTIDVLNVWSGEEQASFKAVVAPFSKTTGITINVEATRDLDAALDLRLSENNPPDIAVIPNPDKLRQMASQNQLVRLDTFLDMDKMHRDYASDWLSLASYKNNLFALVYKVANKGTIWYSPRQFQLQGYPIPTTWEELISLSNTIARHGKYPWAMGVKNATVSGWPAADWVAEMYLKQYGKTRYDQWVNHEIPWTDPSIKEVFQLFGAIVGGKHYLAGAPQSVLNTNYDLACYEPFTSPPEAYMDYLGDFATGFITSHFPHAQPGNDFDFFPFPTLDTQYASSVTVGADLVVAMRDSTNVRQFMTYLSTAEAQTIWIKRGGANSINQEVNLADYPNDVARASASMLINSTTFRFGAGDMMPFPVEQAFWQGMLAFIADQKQLDSILHTIELVAQQSYGGY